MGLARLVSASSIPVLDFVHLGRSVSLRWYEEVGSSVSVMALARFVLPLVALWA